MIFLDPPFADDPWSWLLPACAARLAPDGFVYAEAGAPLAAARRPARSCGRRRRGRCITICWGRAIRPCKVVYPGTFDPFTRGHEDLVRRAARLFDSVVVAVADSEAKRPFFDTAARVEMAREVLAPLAQRHGHELLRRCCCSSCASSARRW